MHLGPLKGDTHCTLLDSLWPSHPTWNHSPGSTLAQVMFCCLTTPSHRLDHCWPIIKVAPWHTTESNVTRRVYELNLKNVSGDYTFIITNISLRGFRRHLLRAVDWSTAPMPMTYLWNVNCEWATAFIFYTRTDVLVKVSKFLRQKMSRPERDSNPQPSDSCRML